VARLTTFRRLALTTTVFAYLQVVLGGVVRVSGSGLGCPDWPLCNGRPYPPPDVHSIIEYSHRTVGTLTGLLLIATVVMAWLLFRSRRPSLAWLATGALAAVVLEGIVGGVVVIKELQPWLVLVHLGIAMVILGLLALTAVRTLPPGLVPTAGVRRLILGAATATFVLLLTGSSVVASGADDACHSWPLCGGGLQPDFGGVNAFTMLHRFGAGLVALYLVYVAIRAWQTRALRLAAAVLVAALALQVAAGGAAAVLDNGAANGLHVALGSAVWLAVVVLAALCFPRPTPAPEPERPAIALERSAA
jgi:heme A synthase